MEHAVQPHNFMGTNHALEGPVWHLQWSYMKVLTFLKQHTPEASYIPQKERYKLPGKTKEVLSWQASTYLMVPVGEGNGEPMLASCSGMLILRGWIFLLGGEGTRAGGGSRSSTRDWNCILMFVLGNLSVHLREVKSAKCETMYCMTFSDTQQVI